MLRYAVTCGDPSLMLNVQLAARFVRLCSRILHSDALGSECPAPLSRALWPVTECVTHGCSGPPPVGPAAGPFIQPSQTIMERGIKLKLTSLGFVSYIRSMKSTARVISSTSLARALPSRVS